MTCKSCGGCVDWVKVAKCAVLIVALMILALSVYYRFDGLVRWACTAAIVFITGYEISGWCAQRGGKEAAS